MNTNDLKAIGEYLYGGGWQSALAEALQVSDRTMRRWYAGESTIPDGAAQDAITLAACKQVEHIAPVLESVMSQHGAPEEIELKVYKTPVQSIHKRTWSFEADVAIKSVIAELLKEQGIKAKVVEV